MMNREYYKTICIEPYEVLIDYQSNVHPYASNILSDLIKRNYYITIWSIKGINFCKKIVPNEYRNSINILEKTAVTSSSQFIKGFFYCIDTDTKFARRFKTWSVLPPFNVVMSDPNRLINTIESYIKYSNYVLSNIDKNYYNGNNSSIVN